MYIYLYIYIVAFVLLWALPQLEISFKILVHLESCFCKCLECAMENYWASALQYSMHPIMAKLAHWLDQAFGQELVVQHEGILGIAKASGLLPIGEFFLGASPMSGMKPLVAVQ